MKYLYAFLATIFVSAHGMVLAEPLPPFRFVENRQQWDEEILFRADLPNGYLFLEKQALTYSFYHPDDVRRFHPQHEGHAHDAATKSPRKVQISSQLQDNGQIRGHGFRARFLNAQPKQVTGQQALTEKRNYYLGNRPEKWASGVAAYQGVVYQDLYEGIDLHFLQTEFDLKYEYHVAPGADPRRIQVQYEGQESLSVRNGHLYILTSINEVIEQKPYCYQIVNGEKREVPSQYLLEGNAVTYYFPEGYEPSLPLIIDPVLVFSTFSGSISDNWGYTATPGKGGKFLAGGIVFGADFPATVGAFQVAFDSLIDVSLQQYDSTGSILEYATFLGGELTELPQSMMQNSKGEWVVMGLTGSSLFPVTDNGFQRNFGGGTDGFEVIGGVPFRTGSDLFVTVLSADGTRLTGSTYIGGGLNDGINDPDNGGGGITLARNYGDEFRGELILDTQDRIYLATNTFSQNFPKLGQGYLAPQRGGLEAIVTSLSPDAAELFWTAQIGGSGPDAAYSLRVMPNGNIAVCGGTASNNIPTTSGVLLPQYQGSTDGWLAVLSGNGQSLVTATYLGTTNYDQAYLLDLDTDGSPTVFGQSLGNYPTTNGTYRNAGGKQFIHQLNANLTATQFSTVFGSGGLQVNIVPTAFLLNDCGNIYLSGWGGDVNQVSGSYLGGNTLNMPTTTDGFQRTTDGSDFYLMVLSSRADTLLYATYFGGPFGTGEHVDGGTARFDEKGVVYQSVCSCGNSGYPVSGNAYDRINDSRDESVSPRCNNAAFKFDLEQLRARFVVRQREACAPVQLTFPNTSVGGRSFQWEVNGQLVSTAATGLTYQFDQPGLYVIRLRAFDPASCRLTDETVDSVRINAANFALTRPSPVCAGETVQLNASGADSYLWLPIDAVSDPTSPNPVALINATTTFTVRFTNANGCSADSTFTVFAAPKPTVSFQALVEETCDSLQQIRLVNESSQAFSYRWRISDGRTFTQRDPGVLTFDRAGTYTISLALQTGNCSDSVTISQPINIVPSSLFFRNITISPDTVLCEGGSAPLTVTGGVTYLWTPATGLSNPNIPNPIASPTRTQTYRVTVGNGVGCTYDTSVTVTVIPEIQVDFQEVGSLICDELPTFNFSNRSRNGLSYVWDFGNGQTSTDENPTQISYPDSGTYRVRLRVANGPCEEVVEKDIEVRYLVPGNAITPNGDGKNDVFILNTPTDGWKLAVYNRWGEPIFEDDDYQNNWDATGISEGMYYFLITAPDGQTCRGWLRVLK